MTTEEMTEVTATVAAVEEEVAKPEVVEEVKKEPEVELEEVMKVLTLPERMSASVSAVVSAMQSDKQARTAVQDVQVKIDMAQNQLDNAKNEKVEVASQKTVTSTGVGASIDMLITVLEEIKTSVGV